jgi:hypothetical protein
MKTNLKLSLQLKKMVSSGNITQLVVLEAFHIIVDILIGN